MKKKILIIEDEVDLCKFLELRFQKHGFTVITANDGLDGFNKAKEEKPNVIILDLMLPKLRGEEVCKRIRKDADICSTPIIMLTAKCTDADKILGRVIGADSYFFKPFDGNKLLEEVKKFIGGNNFMQQDRVKELKAKLLELLKEKALKKGNFILSSGKTSNYYLDGRLITLTPEGAYLVASIILEYIKNRGLDAVGGPTLGADPIVGAVAALSHMNKIPLKTFIVRKAAKEHGTQRQIEGPALEKSDKVIIVDDVATTGKALIEAKHALSAIGVKVDNALVIVDRQEGAKENLAQHGLELESIFRINDFCL